MAGRKIFPQSVQLDEIKTVILFDARVNDTAIFSFWSEALGSSCTPCHVAVAGGESLLFWSLARSSSVCCLTMWTHVHASPFNVENTDRSTAEGPPQSHGNSASAVSNTIRPVTAAPLMKSRKLRNKQEAPPLLDSTFILDPK